MASSSNCKQQWQVKQQMRNWLDLPSDITANILQRIGVVNILENAQSVCTAWRKICKDPSLWRVIHLDSSSLPKPRLLYDWSVLWRDMCKDAVDRSQGQLVDFAIDGVADDELFQYIADRSSHLTCLKIISCYGLDSWPKCLERFVSLEELSLYMTDISKEGILTVGCCCPMLKTLRVNQVACSYLDGDTEGESINNEIAIAIGENLPLLRHLELIGDSMSNIGLQTILDGCCHLDTLDLRQCFYIDLIGDLGKRCSEQIKCLKLPDDY